MSTLLIKNLQAIVTCDDADAMLENADIYIEDNRIAAIGKNLDKAADRVIDGSHKLCYPGLINTHHHLYQQFSRNLPAVQNLELFDWLKALYEVWKNLDTDVIRASSLTGMGELMKNGCTTCFDHHYVFPANTGDLLEAQFGAADTLGIRMAASRGSMDLSKKDGGLPPDTVVQTVDEIMKDSARLIEKETILGDEFTRLMEESSEPELAEPKPAEPAGTAETPEAAEAAETSEPEPAGTEAASAAEPAPEETPEAPETPSDGE